MQIVRRRVLVSGDSLPREVTVTQKVPCSSVKAFAVSTQPSVSSSLAATGIEACSNDADSRHGFLYEISVKGLSPAVWWRCWHGQQATANSSASKANSSARGTKTAAAVALQHVLWRSIHLLHTRAAAAAAAATATAAPVCCILSV